MLELIVVVILAAIGVVFTSYTGEEESLAAARKSARHGADERADSVGIFGIDVGRKRRGARAARSGRGAKSDSAPATTSASAKSRDADSADTDSADTDSADLWPGAARPAEDRSDVRPMPAMAADWDDDVNEAWAHRAGDPEDPAAAQGRAIFEDLPEEDSQPAEASGHTRSVTDTAALRAEFRDFAAAELEAADFVDPPRAEDVNQGRRARARSDTAVDEGRGEARAGDRLGDLLDADGAPTLSTETMPEIPIIEDFNPDEDQIVISYRPSQAGSGRIGILPDPDRPGAARITLGGSVVAVVIDGLGRVKAHHIDLVQESAQVA
ncbi:hypothetical protein [Pseudooceanicola aestuarii]|uniref:hypothetical protein n=1 Tax=Pseudooceanicola aestuarii TaxID=2697319 RepID=UPI0013D678B1|nr:hypothetical protein [Pseudooceanicola aestuarii]